MLFSNCLITVFCLIKLIETGTTKYQTFTQSGWSGFRLEPMKVRLKGYSVIMCGAECEKTVNCVSFSYHATMELCEINRYNPNDVLATTFERTGWEIFIKYEEKCWLTDHYEGFVRDGMCYFWASGTPTIPWADGRNDCQDNEAELVCIDSEAENQALIDHVPVWLWWFGLNDLDGDGVFTCNGNEPPFTKWAPDKPGDALCIAVHEPDTLWYDGGCHSDIAYVCEKRLYQ